VDAASALGDDGQMTQAPQTAALAAIAPVALPHNLEAEQALLGALMIDNRLVEQVQLVVRGSHFYEGLHGALYDAILRLIDQDRVATPITLKPLFEKDERFQQLGGLSYLANLTAATPALIGVKDFARHVYDLAQLRELIRVGRTMVEQAMEPSLDLSPNDLVKDAELALYKVAEDGGVQGEVRSFAEATRTALEMVERALQQGGGLSGITTGLDSLNKMIGGLQRSDLIILAGRPGMGKSALATNMAVAAAKRARQEVLSGTPENMHNGAAVAFFSLEMSADQLATRVIAEEANIPSEDLRKGELSEIEFRRLARAAQDIEDMPVFIDDTPGLTIAALRTRARRLKRQKKIGMIVVDYLQLLQGASKGGEANRVQEISEISRGLKTLAKELNVPVLALSQLSRQVESREDKRPQLSDLRESGSIEQDADIVLFIYREEYYHALRKPDEESDRFAQWLEKGERVRGRAEVIIAKHRHGATGTAHLQFTGATTKFADAVEQNYTAEQRG
jgi:replicative DNA helicase